MAARYRHAAGQHSGFIRDMKEKFDNRHPGGTGSATLAPKKSPLVQGGKAIGRRYSHRESYSNLPHFCHLCKPDRPC
ncbi:hypothetical protein BvCmsNSNP012_03775 [Escherichia coli]|nr:hypothetical protein BvCmsNSNP012_03775 [Escherichia coli]